MFSLETILSRSWVNFLNLCIWANTLLVKIADLFLWLATGVKTGVYYNLWSRGVFGCSLPLETGMREEPHYGLEISTNIPEASRNAWWWFWWLWRIGASLFSGCYLLMCNVLERLRTKKCCPKCQQRNGLKTKTTKKERQPIDKQVHSGDLTIFIYKDILGQRNKEIF